MAITNLRALGSNSATNVVAGGTLAITLTAGVAIGETAFLGLGFWQQPGALSVTDNKGNTWRSVYTGPSAAPLLYLFAGHVTAALLAGDTLTVHLPNAELIAQAVAMAASGVDNYPTWTAGSAVATSSGTAVSAALTANAVGRLLINLSGGYQGSGVAVTPTLTGGVTNEGSRGDAASGIYLTIALGAVVSSSTGTWNAGATFSGSTSQNDVLLAAFVAPDTAPNAPTLTAKGMFDRKQSTTFAWTFSDPDPSDTQSAYELLITRHDTGATVYDSGKVTSTVQSATLPANTLPTGGIQYDWTVKTWDSSGTAGSYAATSAVTPYSSPDAPTLSATGNFNIAQAHTFGWQYNDADAGNTESAYQLTIARVSDGGLVFDTGKKISTANTYTLVAGTLPAGALYRWTVRTWDQHDVAGPYAVAQQFTAAGPPTATITQPTAAQVVTQSALTVIWTYGGLLPQGAYQVRLLQGGVQVYNSGQVLGSVTQATLPALSDASSYQVGLTVFDNTNTAGPETLVSFTTAFVATPTPYIVAQPAADGSSIALTASAPAPSVGQVAAATFEIWRSNDNGANWTRVAVNLPPT